MDEHIKEWLDLAEMDFGVAKHLFETYHPKPLEIICFHCQQAAEKAIKAVIVSYGEQGGMPKLHDLSFLLGQVRNMTDIDEKYFDYADTLTPYGVSLRYPHELFLEEYHAEQAIKYAKEIMNWALATIKHNESNDI